MQNKCIIFIHTIESAYTTIFKGPRESYRYIQISLYADNKNILHVRYKTNQKLNTWLSIVFFWEYRNKLILLYKRIISQRITQ